ncbi:MAG: bacterial transcriptional activator domain-containing protein [Chloroflexi bacterium]|nr:bacterial transcriptional activator domain-containing protein [Chloroflexota bacterium]
MLDVETVARQLKQDLISSIDQLLVDLPTYPGAKAALRVQTLGGFHVWRDGLEVSQTAWGREKALHLFQFFITMHHQYLHKEQIIDRLWPELDMEKGDRDFKVALNSINKALEPTREPRHEPRFTLRYGLAYGLDFAHVWLDTEVFEQLITAANQALLERAGNLDQARTYAIACYTTAVNLYNGDYLPERRYEDWSSAERERLQLLALNTMTTLAELLLDRSPLESVRLAQRVLAIDPVWEDAYRIQMRAYVAQRNRPLAIRTYEKCRKVLEEEFGVEPLPETIALYQQILKNK